MTIKEAAQKALDIQDSCNLSAVVKTFGEAMGGVGDEAHRLKQGTTWVNRHPISIAFVDKTAQLSGIHVAEIHDVSDAHDEVIRLARFGE